MGRGAAVGGSWQVGAMQRIEPAFPDLLPIQYRFGDVPPAVEGVRLDPVAMKLVWPDDRVRRRRGDRSIGRKPVQVLVHAAQALQEKDYISHLLELGCGVVLVLDEPISAAEFPVPRLAGQVVALAPWLPSLWWGGAVEPLRGWEERGVSAGVLLGLAPVPDPLGEVARGVEAAKGSGGSFVVAAPVCTPPLDRRRIVDERYGAEGDAGLEDFFFHNELGDVVYRMERAASRLAREAGMLERLPGPATSTLGSGTFGAGASLLLWARRLDLLDGVASVGWQLRRAARALLASGRDVGTLLRDDNLRILPGFDPWVEAFARSLWCGAGPPFDEVLARWLAC